MESILVFIVAAVLIVGIYALNGWIAMTLWNFIAVSLFSAPQIDFQMGLAIAIALSFIGGFFKAVVKKN